MKIAIVALFGILLSTAAIADDTDKAVGAVVGGLVGSTIGSGDGQKVAIAAGALLGYAIADGKFSNNKAREYCERRVPERYWRNKRTRRQWVNGCMNRLKEDQEMIEQRAYHDGYENRHHR